MEKVIFREFFILSADAIGEMGSQASSHSSLYVLKVRVSV